MSSLKLEYFSIRGLGEYIRTLLIDQGIEFVDDRVGFVSEDWTAKKGDQPYGQLPVLTDGDLRIPQTSAILRHLARKYGLYGETERDQIQCDVILDGVRDLRLRYALTIVYGEWEKKDEFNRETYPAELQKIEKVFKQYDEGRGYVLGDKISFVDYVLFEELDLALTSNAKNLDTVPLLKGFHSRFLERPNLKAYFAKRAADKPAFHGNEKI